MINKKVGEPEKLDQIPVSEESLETINSSYDDQYDIEYWNYFSERLTALEERAAKSTLSVKYSSAELDAIEREISKYRQSAEICLENAYLKYLSAIGFSDDDANFLAENAFIGQSIYDRVQKSQHVFAIRHVVFI